MQEDEEEARNHTIGVGGKDIDHNDNTSIY